MPPEDVKEHVMNKDEADKIVESKPIFPDPAPEEPDSDSSVEEVDMRI